jgi:hypothetical protein
MPLDVEQKQHSKKRQNKRANINAKRNTSTSINTLILLWSECMSKAQKRFGKGNFQQPKENLVVHSLTPRLTLNAQPLPQKLDVKVPIHNIAKNQSLSAKACI